MIFFIATLTSVLFSACQSNTTSQMDQAKNSIATQDENKLSNINFTVLKNYFVKNTVIKLDNPKIESAEKFNQIFGMATTMGKDGKPSDVDFSKQYIIAVIMSETKFATSLQIISLRKNSQNQIKFNYKLAIGQKQSFSSRPFIAIAVDKSESGIIILEETK